MSLEAGEFVEVLEKVNDTWWWVESSEGVVGYAPANRLLEHSGSGDENQWENQEYFSRYGELVISCLPTITPYRSHVLLPCAISFIVIHSSSEVAT